MVISTKGGKMLLEMLLLVVLHEAKASEFGKHVVNLHLTRHMGRFIFDETQKLVTDRNYYR
jgi:hypothetical protein